MSMNVGPDRSKAMVSGIMAGTVGMSAYFLPVTKDRFVRSAFCIQKELTEDKIDKFTETANQIAKKNLKIENKMFLKGEGVSEDIDAISRKCIDLKKIITDNDSVQNIKKVFADNFASYKKSEASMGNIASNAFKRIRWTNFGWGAGIGFIIGAALGAAASKSSAQQ